jgi:hypothetical protein
MVKLQGNFVEYTITVEVLDEDDDVKAEHDNDRVYLHGTWVLTLTVNLASLVLRAPKAVHLALAGQHSVLVGYASRLCKELH